MSGFEGMTCSAAALDIPLPGSATRVGGWLCVEHPGAWGRDVIGDAVLGAELTAELAVRTKAARVRPTLIRRPGRSEFTGARTVLLAASRPHGSWCERLEITDLKQLLDIDLELLNGPPPGIGVPVTDPVTLVCAHGKRDQCCARLGRPIAARLAAEYPELVWECSHTGGHRFAPAMVVLPWGLTYGRVDGDSAVRAVAHTHRSALSLNGFRGRSCGSPIEQVAEIAVRERVSAALDDLTATEYTGADVTGDPAAITAAARVVHRDGRRWFVTARSVDYPPRQASCGAKPKPAKALVVTDIRVIEE
ncbi:sucrase/ferredoxin-like protein [Nocardia nova SH22a]|uniref:Sucrase/ferredoxin-like protein n=1 Tax=Nocardia nova SH22a TaxID=1415166 RepID=W5T9I5_9NOCA|nr:sucrase ferredoxin [Nocardia nova]AHH15852.1 sucrase/ferredoxin-like protein [Nocardia nova SH22a]